MAFFITCVSYHRIFSLSIGIFEFLVPIFVDFLTFRWYCSLREVIRVNHRPLARCAVFAAVISICAWLSAGSGVVFTMQSFAVCLCLQLLGGKWGTASILSYLLLGAVGLPVFSGFRGGIGALLGATGGFLFGFLLMGLVYWLIEALFKRPVAGLLLGFLALYACGTLWYGLMYAPEGGWTAILLTCAVPYILPDVLKLGLSVYLARRLKGRL